MAIDFTNVIIEKDVPIPEKVWTNGAVRDMLLSMQVGDSALLPSTNLKPDQSNVRVRAAKLNIKIEIRKVSDTTFRVWRVE